MTKRQGGRLKAENDFYPTPESAVLPLIPFLRRGWFYEPCAGAGDLVRHLAKHGMACAGACDIAPRNDFIARRNCLTLARDDVPRLATIFITNPPHTHKWLAPIIEHLRKLHPTWLLLPLDWIATKQAAPHLVFCSHVVTIGRMKMDILGSYTSGFDNFVWARFTHDHPGDTVFHGWTR